MFMNPITRDVRGRRVTVTMTSEGWTVREERGQRIVREMTYTDWHRVERAIDALEHVEASASDGEDVGRRD